jgi:surface antigen
LTSNINWQARILAQIEQAPLMNQINFFVYPGWGAPNNTAMANEIESYRCPSDPGRGGYPWTDPSGTRRIGPQGAAGYGRTNYVGSVGHDSKVRVNNNLGAVRGWIVEGRRDYANPGSPGSGAIGLVDFLDGTSNTVAVSECIIGFPSSRVNSPHSANTTPDQVTATDNGCGPNSILGTGATTAARGNSWFRGYEPAEIGFTTLMTPNSKLWDCGANSDNMMFAARSVHPGGVQATLGDASTRFVPETIDWRVWKFLGGAKDGEPVQFP